MGGQNADGEAGENEDEDEDEEKDLEQTWARCVCLSGPR